MRSRLTGWILGLLVGLWGGSAIVEALGPPQGDTQAPTITFTAPPGAPTPISGPVLITVDARDNQGVACVRYELDTNMIAQVATTPFDYRWDTRLAADGQHILKATAEDAAGNQGFASIPINVHNAITPPDQIAPVITPSVPANGTTNFVLNFSATATDANGVTGGTVKLPNGQSTAITYPYQGAWTPTDAGKFAIEFTATDPSGNIGMASAPITVVLEPPKPPPTPTFNPGPIEGQILRQAQNGIQGPTLIKLLDGIKDYQVRVVGVTFTSVTGKGGQAVVVYCEVEGCATGMRSESDLRIDLNVDHVIGTGVWSSPGAYLYLQIFGNVRVNISPRFEYGKPQ